MIGSGSSHFAISPFLSPLITVQLEYRTVMHEGISAKERTKGRPDEQDSFSIRDGGREEGM